MKIIAFLIWVGIGLVIGGVFGAFVGAIGYGMMTIISDKLNEMTSK